MTVNEITDQLDELADRMSAAVDAGQEPEPELVEQYADALNTFALEFPTDCVMWLRQVYAAR